MSSSNPQLYSHIQHTPYRRLHGPIESQVHSIFPHLIHRVRIAHAQEDTHRSLKIDNIVTLADPDMDNKELSMIIDTSMATSMFYTDENGLYISRRSHDSRLPYSAQFYPVTKIAYVEDHAARTTLLTSQTFAMGSTAPGRIEVLLERNVKMSDGRELHSQIETMFSVHSSFMLLSEVSDRVAHGDVDPIIKLSDEFDKKRHMSYPSILAIQTVNTMEKEALAFNLVMLGKRNTYNKFVREYSALKDVRHWPCDIDLITLRTLPQQKKLSTKEKKFHHEANRNRPEQISVFGETVPRPSNSAGVTLHRAQFDCAYHAYQHDLSGTCANPSKRLTSVRHLFGERLLQHPSARIYKSSLPFVGIKQRTYSNYKPFILPGDLQAFEIVYNEL